MEIYPYKRLPHSDSIRLLEFHTIDNEVELRIQDFFLSNAPPYCALSYAWGPSEESDLVKITCQGRYIRVTQNCKDAIEQLAKSDSRLSFLWVDAICIDQARSKSALLERDRQLHLMCEIYKQAKQTLVWLGKDFDGAGICLDAIRSAFEPGECHSDSFRMIETHSTSGSEAKLATKDQCSIVSDFNFPKATLILNIDRRRRSLQIF
jgi:hypothetical protein